jgi:hypothetical protein
MSLAELIARCVPAEARGHPFLSLAEAAQMIPGERPGGVSPNTVYRWGTRGLLLSDGRVIKLKILRLGRKFVTTPESLAAFVEAQQPVESASTATTGS